jgi:preprotein translocase subunit SecE
MIGKAKRFLKDVKVEFLKVSWPTKDELMGSTLVVAVVSAIVAAYIGVVDHLLAMLISLIIR